MRLKNKTAIITRAAGGIGRASAQLFVKEGARVAIFDINEEGMNETMDLIGDPENCFALYTDIRSADNIHESVNTVLDRFGKIDILYNNAAHNRNFKEALETSEDDWDLELDITLKGNFRCSKEVIPHMLKAGSGTIVFTASLVSFVSIPKFAAYSAAKGGLVQLARSLAVDYSPKGIRVNVVAPGVIMTPALEGEHTGELMETFRNWALLKRTGTPESNHLIILDESGKNKQNSHSPPFFRVLDGT